MRVIVGVAVVPLVARRALDGRLAALLPPEHPAPAPVWDVVQGGAMRLAVSLLHQATLAVAAA